MSNIHKKSAIRKTDNLIFGAHERGEGFLWGRYEQQLPLCAFTDNGLSCRKCFNGPCRINPFGDEPSLGVCGADRDQIIMENLFQATLQGVLDTARFKPLLSPNGFNRELPDITPDLPLETGKRLSGEGLIPVRAEQVYEVRNSYFSHKGYLSGTLKDILRLGLIQYGILKEMEILSETLAGHAYPLDPEAANILFVGQVPSRLAEKLQGVQKDKGRGINLFSSGGGTLPFAHTLSDHGTPELAMAMDLDGLIIGPDAFIPGLNLSAKKYDIPVTFLDETKTTDQMACQIIGEALLHRQSASGITTHRMKASPRLEGKNNPIFNKGKEIRAALEAGRIKGVVVILGESNVKQTFFERTLTLIERCLNEKCLVLVGGDLASQADLLDEELSKRRVDRGAPRPSELRSDELAPLAYVGPFHDIPKLVSLMREIGNGKPFSSIPVVISFPEFYRTSTWAAAVSLLALGFSVQIGTRLPFWGSPSFTDILLQQWPKISGGTLLAQPSLPKSEAQAQEIIASLESQGKQKQMK
jgi:anaerobic carbon-monoxide dehydrogenase catalytic subunit